MDRAEHSHRALLQPAAHHSHHVILSRYLTHGLTGRAPHPITLFLSIPGLSKHGVEARMVTGANTPRYTALLVVDMQRDFCAPGGVWDMQGIDRSMIADMIPRLARLLEDARRVGMWVIYIQMTVLPGRVSESPAQMRFNLRLHNGAHNVTKPLLYTVEGTPGHDIIPALAPQARDTIARKYRSSAFWGTNLDMLLWSNGVKTVVVTGCTTEGCVESTARDALFNDYYVVLPEDCVASDGPRQHEASLFLMRHRFDVVFSNNIADIWRNSTTVFHSAS